MKKKQPKPVKRHMYVARGELLGTAHMEPCSDLIPVIIRTLADDRERSRRIRELEKENDELKQSLAVFQRCR